MKSLQDSFILTVREGKGSDILKIVVVSDNHGYVQPLNLVKERHPDADLFVHCGDACMSGYELKGFEVVRGNNDTDYSFPVEKVLLLETQKALVVHGHFFGTYFSTRQLIEHAKKMDCSIVFFGHTHTFYDKIENGVHLINPGSLLNNRDRSVPSYAVVVVEDGHVSVERKVVQ